MTVYADILFLVNLSLNWLSLMLTSKIIKHSSTALKMLAAAALGATVGTVTLFLYTLGAGLAEIGTSFLMCAVAFSTSGFFEYIKICTCLFASGITLGGSLTLIYSFFNRAGIEIPEQNDLSAAVFLMLSVLVTLTATVFEKTIFARRIADFGSVTLTVGDKKLTLSCLCDSGNLLREPISDRQAVLVKADTLRGFLPHEVISYDPLGDTPYHPKIRLLPASTVAGSALMTGFIPDSAEVTLGKRKFNADLIIAIDKSPAPYADAQAILPKV